MVDHLVSCPCIVLRERIRFELISACMRVLLFLLTGILLIASVSLDVRLRYFNAEYSGAAMVVIWEAEAEPGVRTYELHRKTEQSEQFQLLVELQAHGANTPYTVRDEQVYKSPMAMVDYRLEAVLTNGLRQRVAERKVNYTPTAIPRSWGSIKAMFQD